MTSMIPISSDTMVLQRRPAPACARSGLQGVSSVTAAPSTRIRPRLASSEPPAPAAHRDLITYQMDILGQAAALKYP